MTGYLLDENVLRAIGRLGNANVLAWRKKARHVDMHISVITIFEKRRGWERLRRKDPPLATSKLAELDALALAFGARLLPIDGPVAAQWARLVGEKDKNRLDRALAATALVHDLVLVTRNVADVRGCGVRVLDPFRRQPTIELV